MSTLRVSLAPQPRLKASKKVGKPQICVRANNDQAIIAWRYPEPIEDCIGFAIRRRLVNNTTDIEDVLLNRVGFEDETYQKGEQRLSTEWPIQRFIWTDFSVKSGDRVRYQILPVTFNGEVLEVNYKDNSSDWTDELLIITGDPNPGGKASPFQAYFNRGIVSSQFYSLMSRVVASRNLKVADVINGRNTQLRNFLGGFLDNKLFNLLKDIRDNKSLTVYASLYELHQNDLIDLLCSIKDRAKIILANGAAKKKEDKNEGSREALKAAGVTVYDRIVDASKRHFAHNKFLVICENGQPKRVWTGSTNWTPGGLFAQVNNAVLIEDDELAAIYQNEWNAILTDVEAGNVYSDDLYDANANAFPFFNKNSRVWFAPTPDYKDLEDVQELLENAKSSVLFLMFNPGPKNNFFTYIQDLQTRKPELFIHGVINQDPGATQHKPLIFFHNGQQVETDWNAILPKSVKGSLSFWYDEVAPQMVTIHSKVLVIDPFGDTPYLVTGSHNFGPKASNTNDENLLIINERRLAEEYAVNVMAIYDHYRWRYSLFQKHTDFRGLTKDRDWMQQYMNDGLRTKELNFWFA